MALTSFLFRGVRELEACLINDQAHIQRGARGEHVRLIQRALVRLGESQVPRAEYVDGVYGPSTAASVLAFKKKRNIVNRAYQTQADDIVGKMTIAALDREVLLGETQPRLNR